MVYSDVDRRERSRERKMAAIRDGMKKLKEGGGSTETKKKRPRRWKVGTSRIKGPVACG